MQWAYGVTTVPQREEDLLPRTLLSLAAGGFDKPRLFVDGSKDGSRLERKFNLEVTTRWPVIRTAANWILSIYELYLRNPHAQRFALFQDDFVTYRNLRLYLEKCQYPDGSDGLPKGYWNLYTFQSNHVVLPSSNHVGWYLSNQKGRGAVALIFDRVALTRLLATKHMAIRPQDDHRGWRCIDGGVVTAMDEAGYKEYVHMPSLVQHTGAISVMGNKPHQPASSFLEETFNALDLVPQPISTNGLIPCRSVSLSTNPRDVEAAVAAKMRKPV